MLGKRDLYAAPDDTVETWCLLVPEYSENHDCIGWSIGFGNVNQLVRTDSLSIAAVDGEEELLTKLIQVHLRPCRKAETKTTLVTPSRETLPRLRTRLLIQNVDAAFRGFSHFSVEALIDEYFHHSSASKRPSLSVKGVQITDYEYGESNNPIETLWQQVKRIGPLVPRDAMAGTRL